MNVSGTTLFWIDRNDLYFRWTSTAGGAVQWNLDLPLTGRLFELITDPDNSPTDNYDITFTDTLGVDLLQGKGADRDTTTSERVDLPWDSFSGYLTFNVANAGNAKSGLAIIRCLELANG